MNRIKLYENFAEDRAKQRRREAFDKLDDATKKKIYDADVQLKKLKRNFPKEYFVIPSRTI